ncbi:MAG: AI-2E family transporter [Rhizobacter sp.]|nr:AI-2E family transporter [Rhizobacter sp.]
MTPNDSKAPAYLENKGFPLLLVAVSLAFAWILLPFFGTILWACIIALLFTPLYRWLLPRLRHKNNPAALLTLAVVVVIVIVPFAIVSAAMAREAMGIYNRVQSGEWNLALHLRQLFDSLPAPAVSLLGLFDLADFDTLQRRLTEAASEGSQFIATRAFSIGQNTFEFVVNLFITVYIAYFLIRDGDELAKAVRRAIPLSAGHTRELVDKFTTVIRATVKGNLLVAAVQGALGGLAFWYLGVNGALLWAVLMAFLSLLPAVGAALVWAPVAIYFLVTGAIWQGLALAAYGVLVIGLVDNLMRPFLVGKDTGMPDFVVMITTLGGMAVFGINGFVIGPTIAAMFIAVWHIYAVKRPSAGA